jgi:hypothetical protein
MKKKIAYYCIAGALVVAGTLAAFSAFRLDDVRLDERAVLARLNETFRDQRDVTGFAASAVAKSFSASFDSAEFGAGAARLGGTVTIVPRLGQNITVRATVDGVPRFDQERGGVVFSGAKVAVSDIRYGASGPEADPSWVERKLSGWLGDAIAERLSSAVVYRVADAGGWVVQSSLDNVRAEPGYLVAHLSVARLSGVVFTGLLALVAGVAFLIFIIRHPEIFEAVGAVAEIAGGVAEILD